VGAMTLEQRFRRAMARYLGQPLTPEIAAAIEVEAFTEPDCTIDPGRFAPMHYNGYTIQAEHFHEVLPELIPMHQAHWLETERHRHGIALKPRYDNMQRRFKAGRALQFTVRKDGVLVGQLREWLFDSDHTDTPVAEEDTLFIVPERRGGFLPLKLIAYAEQCLLELFPECEVRTNSKLVNRADVLMKRAKYTPFALQHVKFLRRPDPPTAPSSESAACIASTMKDPDHEPAA
jgi:hypothetical protein